MKLAAANGGLATNRKFNQLPMVNNADRTNCNTKLNSIKQVRDLCIAKASNMQISPVSFNTCSCVRGNDPSSKAKQAFSSLEAAINSGDLTTAAAALTQLEKNAPPQSSQNPLSDKVEALSQAIDAGNVSNAKDAFAEIKKAIANLPGGVRASAPSSSDTASKAYDPKDTDKNGQVSLQEELSYALKNPDFLSGGAGAQQTGGQPQLESLFDVLA